MFLFAADLKERPLFNSHCEIPPSASPPFHQRSDRRQPFPLSQSTHRMPRILKISYSHIFPFSVYLLQDTAILKKGKTTMSHTLSHASRPLKPMNKLSWGGVSVKIKGTHSICCLFFLKNAMSPCIAVIANKKSEIYKYTHTYTQKIQ